MLCILGAVVQRQRASGFLREPLKPPYYGIRGQPCRLPLKSCQKQKPVFALHQWVYHRSYWQGRSDAILDMASNANVYARIRQLIADRIWDKMNQNEEEIYKCYDRLTIGYLHHLIFSQEYGSGSDSFRKFRAIETFRSEIIKIAIKQNEEKLRQKEEEIRQIMITLSWKITTPLMWFGNILIKAGIMKDRGGK